MAAIKTKEQIELMRESGRLLARVLRQVSEAVAPGVTPLQLDALAHELILKGGGTPSFLGYRGFPNAACISVNDAVVHGIPNAVPLKEGDIVSLDFGVILAGWHSDSAWTYGVGQISPQAQRLLNITRESLFQGIAKARPGNRVGDIGHAVQRYVESNGYGVVRELVGHGIGQQLHDLPHNIPMYGKAGKGDLLREGMTICIEPMVNQGNYQVNTLPDKWTVVTADGKLSAHFEHTVAILKDGPEILTLE
ncbi:MAG: type I methionyl aminopeptidase [Fimbriimonas sp.]